MMSTVWIGLLVCVCVCLGANAQPWGKLPGLNLLQHDENDDAVNEEKPNLRSHEIEMQKVKIECIVTSRFAHTVMTSTALNKANVSQEVYFEVELPKKAFITNFSMEIDGKTYVGEVKEKEKAKKKYETAVSSGQTAGLVKASGRKMEKFSVSVNIAANSSVTFTLTYEELLQRRLGKYELMIRVKPKQLVQHFEIVATIYEPQGITSLDTNVTFITNDLLPLVKQEVTDKKAHVSFSPTLDQQRKCPDCDGTLIDGDFTITYDVKREKKLGDIQIVNGYFVHFFAPHDLQQLPKNVVFVIDRSGSMMGRKMKQTREALLTILDDLYEEDHFGLVIFDDEIESWRPSLSKATNENIQEAKEYVKSVAARSLTDINGAVLQAVDMLNTAKRNNSLPDNSPSMIILLTDGDPTTGETNTSVIQDNVHNAIGGNISLFCLGFGYDVYYGFLDAMAHQNDGFSRRIYEASDAALQLQGFYGEVAIPLLLEVNLHYPDSMENSVTTNHFSQFFSGSEIVVAGRLNDSQQNTFNVEVSAQMLDQPFVVQGGTNAGEWVMTFPEQEYIFGDFTERLWAYLTIQQLLNKQDTCIPKECENVTAEALDLSLKYNFVTPLTSMVVTKPETNDTSKDALIADKLTEDERRDIAAPASGRVGYSRPLSLSSSYLTGTGHGAGLMGPMGNMGLMGLMDNEAVAVDGDPHFIIELPDWNDALCFNTDDKPGTIFNLVKDPVSGLVVNGKTIGDKMVEPGSKQHTYFGQFGIVHEKFKIRLMVTTQKIIVSEQGKQEHLQWSQTSHVKGINMDLEVSKDQSLTVTLKDTLKFIIVLHKVWKLHPYHQDYLGFYNLDSHHLSQRVHGLLGQFFHGVTYEVSDVFQGKDPDKPDATMFVKGHSLTVTRGWQRDFRKDVKNGENVPCWFIHNNGAGLIDGVLRDYIVSGLFTTVSEGKGEEK
ncbi:inter-alpha-trypsin inhibitor heavy chain H3-like [Hemibagrus wyckioides]|uniref:inter-alpha-trypsin inhibitor heavy chain H3-like n=1 Tax=Hemibagrus wyckioides TaxID=337641 RepID=UPI00266DB56F|nr:inter-alpha-trypsin inhibitor heavy chain H3-like [Hemibagrus wyckioides]